MLCKLNPNEVRTLCSNEVIAKNKEVIAVKQSQVIQIKSDSN